MVKRVVNGWQMSGITTMSTGAPAAVGYSFVNPVDITGSASQGARINQSGDANLPRGERTFSRNFRTEVFSPPTVGTIGNSARTSIRQPGFQNWDISVVKSIHVRERFRTQLRGEFYNAINNTQFSAFDVAARFDGQNRQVNTRLGEMTGTRAARILQVALRISS